MPTFTLDTTFGTEIPTGALQVLTQGAGQIGAGLTNLPPGFPGNRTFDTAFIQSGGFGISYVPNTVPVIARRISIRAAVEGTVGLLLVRWGDIEAADAALLVLRESQDVGPWQLPNSSVDGLEVRLDLPISSRFVQVFILNNGAGPTTAWRQTVVLRG